MVRLTDRPDVTLDAYHGRKITTQQEQQLTTGSILTHCILVDSSTVKCWTDPFVILGVLGLFCHFYPSFDRISF